jgi:hypothetical protein
LSTHGITQLRVLNLSDNAKLRLTPVLTQLRGTSTLEQVLIAEAGRG